MLAEWYDAHIRRFGRGELCRFLDAEQLRFVSLQLSSQHSRVPPPKLQGPRLPFSGEFSK